ncbi:MAG: prepilin-type N-terminal cleavage/methylation domain-containing protein [bacterium]|nr:prepilin-type N-terminal cleavage/methylation domain-containing protein [bacterium]
MKKRKTKGFGLIEVLIASTIIVMSISSLTFVARGALTSTDRTQDRIQAVNLAAEGIEIVRSIRDTNWIDQTPATGWGNWVGSNLGNIVDSSTSYQINYNNSTKRFYLLANQTESVSLNGSIFTRTIVVDEVEGTELMPGSNQTDLQKQAYKVTAIVTTPSKAEINVSEILTNWRPNF